MGHKLFRKAFVHYAYERVLVELRDQTTITITVITITITSYDITFKVIVLLQVNDGVRRRRVRLLERFDRLLSAVKVMVGRILTRVFIFEEERNLLIFDNF